MIYAGCSAYNGEAVDWFRLQWYLSMKTDTFHISLAHFIFFVQKKRRRKIQSHDRRPGAYFPSAHSRRIKNASLKTLLVIVVIDDSIDLKTIQSCIVTANHYFSHIIIITIWTNHHHARHHTPTNNSCRCPTKHNQMLRIRSSWLWSFLQRLGKGFIRISNWGKVSYWDF